MKKLTFIIMALVLSSLTFAQNKPYDESIDVVKQIQTAVTKAKAENKYVLAQVGGNWCPWCLKFAQYAQDTKAVKEIIDKNFVYIHVNWFREREKNQYVTDNLGNPGRFGFPVFVLLDGEGKIVHIQDSEYLEEGQGYSEKKVVRFLSKWTPEAVKTAKR
ncbi:MAG: thioredoxin family protein [Bacteroidales bacterium]|nr:thioredoxin family protein [Bacteroidales bacterium]